MPHQLKAHLLHSHSLCYLATPESTASARQKTNKFVFSTRTPCAIIKPMKSVQVVVASHKDYPMPGDQSYLPLQVGAAIHPPLKNFTPDNTGDNISAKNPYFCELTGLYWAWKNLDADFIGLVHYRRHFTAYRGNLNSDVKRARHILSTFDLNRILDEYPIILPKKRNYVIENLHDHYAHTMYVEPLSLTHDIIAEKYPTYLPAFDRLHERTSAHMFNMFIMPRELLDEYCAWLFDILFTLENRIANVEKYSDFHKRFYGRISELLLDVFLETNGVAGYKELRVIDMDGVNWLKKGSAFLSAKFTGKKYEQSF